MNNKTDEHFWPSYVDLMTSLFFVVLVLFAVSYYLLSAKNREITEEKEKIKKSLDFLKDVENTFNSIADDKLFKYESEFKRFRMVQQVEFEPSQSDISDYSVKNYTLIKEQLIKTGKRLQTVLNTLKEKKESDSIYKNVSYLLIITGMTSSEGGEDYNYNLSYDRALSLYKFWRDNNIEFDSAYKNLIDLQISGVGKHGLGRDNLDDNKNRCFFIQIIPKISLNNGKIK